MAAMKPRVSSFCEMLQKRVDDWLATAEAREIPASELYRHLPCLFLFLTRVALDARLPEPERRAVLATLKYVVAPFDLIPEGVVGTSGFRDDLVLAAVAVERLFSKVDRGLLLEHWEGEGRPESIAHDVLVAGEAMVGVDLCTALRDWLPA